MLRKCGIFLLALGLLIGCLTGCATTPTDSPGTTTTTVGDADPTGSATTTTGGTGDHTDPTDEGEQTTAPTESTTLPPTIATKPNAPTTGYAAVGYVETATKKAIVLLGDGTHGTVNYTGTDPKSGAVHKYTYDASGKYAFTYLQGNPHLKAPTDQLKSGGTAFYGNGEYMWGIATTEDKLMHYYVNQTPIFIRYSAVEWRLTKLSDMAKNDTVHFVLGYALDVKKNGIYQDKDNLRFYDVGAMVLGSADANGKLVPCDLTLFGNPKADVQLGTVTKPTSVTTKPTSSTTDNTAKPTSGYAAVGEVDTTNKRAVVLLDNGNKATVTYAGTAPKMGAVHKYSASGNRYTFTQLNANTHLKSCSQFSSGYQTVYGDKSGSLRYFWNATDKIRHYDVGTAPIFIRYSATDWRLTTIQSMANLTQVTVPAYFLDVQQRNDYKDQDGHRWYIPGAVVIGRANNDFIYTPSTKLFNDVKANVVLGKHTAVETGMKKDATVLFIGDSITDGGRDMNHLEIKTDMAYNHPKYVSEYLIDLFPDENFTFYNTGIRGNTVEQLYARLQEDCYDLDPDYIVMLIGINDCWMHANGFPGRDTFETQYRKLINALRQNTNAKIILMQPYLLEATKEMQDACVIENVSSYIPTAEIIADVECKVAAEYGLTMIYLDEIFKQAIASGTAKKDLAVDAIHPGYVGIVLMTDRILDALGINGYSLQYDSFDLSAIKAKYGN